MTPTPEVQERLRQYLLGQLADDAREQIERDLLVSEELFEELLVIEDELTDEYLNRKLTNDDRNDFEKHFLVPAERQDKLRFGRALKRHLSAQSQSAVTGEIRFGPRAWERFRSAFSSPLGIAAFAILVVGIAFGVWRIFIHQSDVDKGLLALNAAYREQRPIESRISSLAYAPYPKTRGPNDSARFDSVARTRAEAILANALNEHADATAHHALGQVFLANRQFDQAIQQFDEAVKAGLNNPKLYSDLGAAWLEKGRVERLGPEPGKGTADLARALGNLNKAIEIENKSLEARFNRAHCLQLMQLPDQAEKEWREYLKLDATSAWAEEAKRNLKQLEQQKSANSTIYPVEEFLKAYQAGDNSARFPITSSMTVHGIPAATEP